MSTLFVEAADGFTAHLAVTLPATRAASTIEQHLQHFAVELRSWTLNAADERAAN